MDYVYLCLAALAAGAVNAIAGGGTLLTFPTLFGVLGSARADIANATSTVSLFPGSFASVWGYRAKLAACKRWIVWLTLPSALGGALGASLVEANTFRVVVPYLILAAALLFALQPTIARLFKHQHLAEPSRKTLIGVTIIQFVIGVYGGYFGAGIGILMLSSLAFLGLDDIHHVNALKSYLAFCMNITGAVIFVVRGMVDWQYAVPMAVAAIVGGYLGARWAQLLRPIVVRWIVIVVGFALAAYYFARHVGYL